MAVALQTAIAHKQIYGISEVLKFHRWKVNRLKHNAIEGILCCQGLGVNSLKGHSS